MSQYTRYLQASNIDTIILAFQVQDVLGEGSFSTVYLAESTIEKGGFAAIKVVQKGMKLLTNDFTFLMHILALDYGWSMVKSCINTLGYIIFLGDIGFSEKFSQIKPENVNIVH